MNSTPAQRDAELRASILEQTSRLAARAVDGWVTGNKLAIAARDRAGVAVADEAHCDRLLADLVSLLLVAERDAEPTGGIGPRELRHRKFKLTDLGWRLWAGQVDPMPGIAGRGE